MNIAMRAVEEVLRDQALGLATNRPRSRVATPVSQLHVMSAGDRRLNVMGLKSYTVSKRGARFLVLLYQADSGDLLAVIEADRLGQMRTGAASGVATKYLAAKGASTVGIYGTGWQAESQLLAVCAARQITSVHAYSRDEGRRTAFAEKMTNLLGIPVHAASSPEEAARDQSIIVTATTAREPVMKGEWVSPGTHLNVAGSNFLSKAEVDIETIKRAGVVAVDSIEQSKREAGDLVPALERGVISWESVIELGRIIAGSHPGRTDSAEVTLFKSNGIALEDIATALKVYHLARDRGVGEEIELGQ